MRLNTFITAVDRNRGIADPALARSLDIPSSTYHRWVQDWVSPFAGVRLAPWHDPRDPVVLADAALASVGGEAVLSRWTAAHLLGLETPTPRVHLSMPSTRRRRSSPGLLATPVERFDRGDVLEIDGRPVTPVPWLLAELTPRVGDDRLLNLAIDARFRGLLPQEDLEAELALWPRLPGRARLAALAESLRGDGSDSGFEHRTVRRLADEGLPPTAQQVPVESGGRRYHIDAGWIPEQVGIECLSLRYHSDRAAIDIDAGRANDIAELGEWIILALTWTTFLRDWPSFVARVRRVLARRRLERGLPLA